MLNASYMVTYSHGYESFMYMTFIAVLFRPKANVKPIDGSICVAIATKPIGVRRRRPTRLLGVLVHHYNVV